jgi:hypothetical protein
MNNQSLALHDHSRPVAQHLHTCDCALTIMHSLHHAHSSLQFKTSPGLTLQAVSVVQWTCAEPTCRLPDQQRASLWERGQIDQTGWLCTACLPLAAAWSRLHGHPATSIAPLNIRCMHGANT